MNSEEKPKRRATEAQRAASRANGARSRGPVTAHGKEKSSTNSLKHGLLARVLPISDAEAQMLEGMKSAYAARLTPRDTLEWDVLGEFTVYKFQVRQTWRMHTATLQMQMARDLEEVDKQWSGIEPVERQALAIQASLAHTPALLLLERYLRMYSNLADRALNTYMRLRGETLPPDFPIDLPPVTAFDAAPLPAPPASGPELPNEPETETTPPHSTASEPSGLPANPAPPEPPAAFCSDPVAAPEPVPPSHPVPPATGEPQASPTGPLHSSGPLPRPQPEPAGRPGPPTTEFPPEGVGP